MLNEKPTLFRVVSVDYLSLLSVMFPVVFWGLSGYFYYIGDDALQIFVILSIAFSIIGIPLLFWRYQMISSVFEDGLEAPGMITRIGFFRGRGRVDYAYSYQGQKYTSGNAISRSKHTRNLMSGQQVTVLVDRNNPKRAFVKEIYL